MYNQRKQHFKNFSRHLIVIINLISSITNIYLHPDYLGPRNISNHTDIREWRNERVREKNESGIRQTDWRKDFTGSLIGVVFFYFVTFIIICIE